MIKLFVFGLLIGVSDLVPGISGGTMAVILGIYNQLVSIIGGFFTHLKQFISNVLFLLPIFVGIALSILIFSRFFHFLLTEHRVATFSVFIGLVLGSLPHLFRSSFPHKKDFSKYPYLWIFIFLGILLPLWMILMHHTHTAIPYKMEDFHQFSLTHSLILFSVGVAAAIAMILPGISGSLLLILLGFYDPIIEMIAFNNIFTYIVPVLTFTLGVGVGIYIGSFVISKLLALFHKATMSFILGIIGGSFIYIAVVEVFPYLTFGFLPLMIHLFLFIIGFFISYHLEKMNLFFHKG